MKIAADAVRPVSAPSPFDGMAANYDDAFTNSRIGQVMRRAVWRWADACFRPGERVLELGCGTGEDAVHLARRGVHVLATDAAAAMVETARAKVAKAGMCQLVTVEQLSIEEVTSAHHPVTPSLFDGVFSNFGALNCVNDLVEVGRTLATLVRPAGRALMCVMGPLVPWEWGWYLLRGEPRKAFRRLRRGGTSWRGLTIRYPTTMRLQQAFAPCFALRRVGAVGALVPPSYAEDWAQRHPHLLDALDRWERRWERMPPLPWLADHYLVEFERV